MLFVDRKAVGIIEAKKEGTSLSGVDTQSQKYLDGLPPHVQRVGAPLPFAYESTGVETVFRDVRDPDYRSRRVFSFHRPGTLMDRAREPETLRARLKTMPLRRLGLVWVGTLYPRTIVVWRAERRSVSELARTLPLKWRKRLGVRAVAVNVYAPKYGSLRSVVTRNRHANHEYIVTNDLGADLTKVILRKMSRWSIETLFRDTKQYAGLEACQCRVDQAMVRHVGLVLLTFVVLQMMRRSVEKSVGSVKECWQLEVMRDGESPPPLLKACPPHLRATA